ncbi:hypothetical protein P171DRAFT_460386 [Karstenula rhodostoma CBS 690.94]|uniref:Fungal STAND N-terminal Goodbye domain-containing protein n=1 Tax=Karstenula rhodostoma CBS 690.94 TaxID=1392251 RepID=A0A9P4UGB6_9PLEO|nr:hypothetical protein P171DRAFT_460386 [Karstenula rhodostoma CBS 690.94]
MSNSTFNLQAEWREACWEFIRATQMDLNVKSPTAAQITAQLDKLNEAKEEEGSLSVGKAKRAVENTLRAVQTIGHLLAQGAQLTGFGGPANVTMNCVSFLIDAGFAYKKIAENIDNLFSQIGPIMERAEVYIKDRAVIGPQMELTTHRMLMAVVRTCQHCIEILRPRHSKRSKTKQFFEVALFQSDSVVQQQIDTLVTLQEQEMKMASTVTVTTVKKTAADVKIVGADVKSVATGVGMIGEMLSKNDAATAEEKMKKQFKAKLDVDDSSMRSLQLQYRNRREGLKHGTCAWLKDDSQYARWSDPEKESAPVIILSGDEGSGKSRYPQGRDDSTRISLAYFYCTRSAQSGQNVQNSSRENRSAKAAPSVKEMLRTWACQIMENDTFYRKNVHKLEDILQKLFLDQLPNGAIFFLLLDETHELDEDGCSELSILLDSLRIMLESRAPSSAVTIKLEDRNKANMLACFKATSTEIQKLKNWVISELPAAVNGNFLLAERKLQEVNKCQDVGSVRQLIEKIKEGANLFDSIDKEVSTCNRIFSTKQVPIVNALLLWVIYAAWELQLYELESILYVQEQHKPFQPLAKEIREDYSVFFDLAGLEDDPFQYVSIKSSAHAEYFKDASKQRKSSDSSSNQALSKGEIEIVRHFVKNLCEQRLYENLGLADFFDQKLLKSDSLAGEIGEEAESLRSYARNNLTNHLKQVDLDVVDPMIKAEMGPLLVKMFTNEKVVQSSNDFHWSSWAYNDVGLSYIVRLLKSSAVVKNVVRDDKRGEAWINEVLRAKDPELELLRAQTPAMAKAWLKTERTWDTYRVFLWWFGYYNKVENTDTPAERIKEPPWRLGLTSSEAIKQIYEKEIASLFPNMGFADSVGVRNLGMTLLECKHVAEAIDTLNEALIVDPDDLVARNALADAHATEIKTQSVLPNWDEALRHKDLVIEQLKAGKKLYTDEDTDASRKSLTSGKAVWLRELKRYEESQELLRGLLEEDPGNDSIRLELMRTLCQYQKYGEIIELVQAMENEVDPSTNNTAASRFLQYHAVDDTCHTVLVSAFQQESQLEGMKSYYRLAIKGCASNKERIAQWRHFHLTDRLASILFKFGPGPPEREEAITLWEKAAKDYRNDRTQCIRQLCKAYIAQAREAGPGSPIADAMIAKVKAFLQESNVETEETDVSQAEVRALLARYYRAVGDRVNAQETLRPDMELALRLLSDDDEENDWQGYRKLGDALMDFGAMDDAQAAWSLIQPKQGISHLLERPPSPNTSPSEETPPRTDETSSEDGKNEPSSSPNDNDSEGTPASSERPRLKRANTTMVPTGPLSYHCDGHCGTSWTYADDFHVCCECVDVQFNRECHQKLLAGQLERDVCDAKHDFLHVPAWTLESARRARDKKVLVGDSEKKIDAWLRETEQAWQLSVLDVKPGLCA